jgi:iron complex transport system substrate-binding protein
MRRSIVLFLAILLLVACGSSAAPSGNDSAAGASGNLSAAAANETRTIRHALGEIAVPANPQRVIVLDTGALANALALGVKPVGAVLGNKRFVRYLGDAIADIEDLSSESGEPDLERALALKPDLIIGTKAINEANYATLSRIAPTVLAAAQPSQQWKAYFTFVGEALGKSQQAQQLQNEYNARVAEFKRKMGERLATTVSIVRSQPDSTQVYLKKTFVGATIEELGLQRPPSQDRAPENFVDNFENLSLELIPQLDADVIFWMQLDEQEGAGIQQAMRHPLWAQLNAVRQGRVYEVPFDVWAGGWNITGAHRLLDDLFKYLVEEQS